MIKRQQIQVLENNLKEKRRFTQVSVGSLQTGVISMKFTFLIIIFIISLTHTKAQNLKPSETEVLVNVLVTDLIQLVFLSIILTFCPL